jgi:recombination protein RecR
MLNSVPTLAQLIKTLQQVPYLATKNIYRLATYFLQLEPQKLEHLCAVLLKAKENIVRCQICFVWKEKDVDCAFCTSEKKDRSLVCVVETWQELLAIEKTGGYNGVYHILGGVICPLEGVGPEQLNIQALVDRVQKYGVKEIILATNQTPEGEATASFLAHKLKATSVTISCLARGIPVGSSLEFMDRLTVYKALSERRPF